ncbi:hypothetical protein L3Y34_010489 [Caenorhabditis briggsae]|uniref:Uncharacterized protein n=1 Tax=Caenorhabditis briggsae TaxID=6238 RepID=A0AAE8ZTP4_CAEBR|nr:hypothetical protein L3Y34_010489 [Caenorhabditis briggsae]
MNPTNTPRSYHISFSEASNYLNLVDNQYTGLQTMLDYKGVINNITGFAKKNFGGVLRQAGFSSSDNGASTSQQAEERGRNINRTTDHVRLTSEEARTSPLVACEAREDGIYTDENDCGSPFEVVSKEDIEKLSNIVEKKEEVDQKKKKKSRRELNIPQRDMFAPDFKLMPDEDLPGFSPIDSEWSSSEDESLEAERISISREFPAYVNQHQPPPLKPLTPQICGLNPDIPNEYDPVIGIISIQGVRIPRSKPIDIVKPSEPRAPFFGANSELHVMLIVERMYDVFKERIRNHGKVMALSLLAQVADMFTAGHMCGRFVPVELADGSIFFYDYETVSFITKPELIDLLSCCEEKHEDFSIAASVPAMFFRETKEGVLRRSKEYNDLMDRKKIYLRRKDYMKNGVIDLDFDIQEFPLSEITVEQKQIIENKLGKVFVDHEEMEKLFRTISQDIEDAERFQGHSYVRRSTLAMFDARVRIPSVVN